MGTLSHIIDDGLLLRFDASSGYPTHKFVECSHQFSRRETLVEKFLCEHGMLRKKVVIIMASPTVSYQL